MSDPAWTLPSYGSRSFDLLPATVERLFTGSDGGLELGMAPLEGRGVVASWDTRLGQLTIYSAAQMPHITRTGLAECLGLDHAQVRVISPDVGGGFGYKGILLPEEVALG